MIILLIPPFFIFLFIKYIKNIKISNIYNFMECLSKYIACNNMNFSKNNNNNDNG